jgi:hypothetical protein
MATNVDHPPPRINKRRLRLIISGVLTVAAAAYALFLLVPIYESFAEDSFERRIWKAAGFDDPEVRRRAHDACMAGVEAQSFATPFPEEELAQREHLCSQPLSNPWIPGPPWWETPIAFIKTNASMLFYAAVAVVVGPWLIAFFLVRLLPAGVMTLWRWLRTPDS